MQCLTTVTTLCNQEDCQGDFQQAMQAVPFVSKRQSSLFYHILIHFTLEHFASLTDNGVNWFKVLSCVGFWSLENLKGHEAGEGPQRERYAVQNPGGKHNLGQLVTRHHKTAQDISRHHKTAKCKLLKRYKSAPASSHQNAFVAAHEAL